MRTKPRGYATGRVAEPNTPISKPKKGQSANRPPTHNPSDPLATDPPAGLDPAKQAAAQTTAHQAEVLREGVFPALMASAVGLDQYIDTAAYRTYLAGIMADLGDPRDPIERMLVEQICMAHFRTAQLHARAAGAEGVEAVKILNSVTARLLGEVRRTALALAVYRTTVPAAQRRDRFKLLKAAE